MGWMISLRNMLHGQLSNALKGKNTVPWSHGIQSLPRVAYGLYKEHGQTGRLSLWELNALCGRETTTIRRSSTTPVVALRRLGRSQSPLPL